MERFCVILCLAAMAHRVLAQQQSASQIYIHGEAGFRCIRIPETVAVQNGVLLSFAAARCFPGDSCFPSAPLANANNYSAHVVKRSTDGGVTWSAMHELQRNEAPGGMCNTLYSVCC